MESIRFFLSISTSFAHFPNTMRWITHLLTTDSECQLPDGTQPNVFLDLLLGFVLGSF